MIQLSAFLLGKFICEHETENAHEKRKKLVKRLGQPDNRLKHNQDFLVLEKHHSIRSSSFYSVFHSLFDVPVPLQYSMFRTFSPGFHFFYSDFHPWILRKSLEPYTQQVNWSSALNKLKNTRPPLTITTDSPGESKAELELEQEEPIPSKTAIPSKQGHDWLKNLYFDPTNPKHLKPSRLKYVLFAYNQALEHGLDPILFCNQLYRESKYNCKIGSNKGAKGVGQFMPFFLGKYEFKCMEDFYNPYKSIISAAQHMKELKAKHKGDQRLALIEYNAGYSPIAFVKKSLGKQSITFKDWREFMEKRRKTKPTTQTHAWQNETLRYCKIITQEKEAKTISA